MSWSSLSARCHGCLLSLLEEHIRRSKDTLEPDLWPYDFSDENTGSIVFGMKS